MKQSLCHVPIEELSLVELCEGLMQIEPRQNIILVVSENGSRRWELENFIKRLGNKHNVTWINHINPNPTQKDIYEALIKVGSSPIDKIIGIGGGSTLDLVKGIKAFYGMKHINIDAITDAIENKRYPCTGSTIEIIAIPTTAGTGSEMTKWATIWDVRKKQKYSIEHECLYAKKTYVVAELLYTQSKKMILITGLDALSHAVESYWARTTTLEIQELALQAIESIIENLYDAIHNRHPEALKTISRAATLSAIAFSNTKTTACHSISYPLTLQYNIEHGLAVAMTLYQVAVLNKECVENQRLYIFFDKIGGLQNWLKKVSEGITPLELVAFNIRVDEIISIADGAFTLGRMDNNPRVLTREDVIGILENIYKL